MSEVGPPLAGTGTLDAGNIGSVEASRYYTETGHYVKGAFLTFYDRVPDSSYLFGLPLTEEFSQPSSDGTTMSVQYFERARLEYHAGSTPQMQLGIMAPQTLAGRTFDRALLVPSTGSRLYFAETGHTLSGGFLEFWNLHGGLAIFGYLVSEEITEDGLTVQYFERARMEYPEDLQGTPYAVQRSVAGGRSSRVPSRRGQRSDIRD